MSLQKHKRTSVSTILFLQDDYRAADPYFMNCPKCGFQQGNVKECQRCGVVFSKFHHTPPVHFEKKAGSLKVIAGQVWRFYKVFRWITLGILVLVLILILRTPPPPVIVIPPDTAQIVEHKVQHFVSNASRGSGSKLELDQMELNAWVDGNLALKKDGAFSRAQIQGSVMDLAKTATAGQGFGDDSLQRAQSTVRDIKIELKNDLLRAYIISDLHGKDMSIELEGRISVLDGYLKLEPTRGKIGSLPLFSTTLRAAADRLFSSPANREKFKLPPYIQDIRIEDGKLMVVSSQN